MTAVARKFPDFVMATGCLAIGLLTSTPTIAQHQHHSDLQRLGKVDFKVSCTPQAQAEFNTGMALIHSFDWSRAGTTFEGIAKSDPKCGMAHWGRAMTALDNPFIWPANLPPQKLNDISAMLQAARTAGLPSEREKGYVEALAAFVRDHDKLGHRERIALFEAEMNKLSAANPSDTEATILAALVTSAHFDPADKTYANQLKAARALEPIFKAMPNHPGVAHYLIHSYDYPPIAKHGLAAAKAYAKIAPDAPHALHMPSHIFTRLGLWKESIAANRESHRTASAASFDGHHASDYMVYAYLQIADDQKARAAMQASMTAKPVDHFGSAFSYAAMPARMALERGNWKDAAQLALTPSDYPWKKYPQAEAINAFARGIGASRIKDAALTRQQHARLLALRDAAKDLKLTYWADQIDIQAAAVEALAHCADGKTAACIAGLQRAAEREDATEKHAVTPGPLVPSRELLAETLLDVAGKPAEALKAFEAVLDKEPNRYRATSGAMYAARRSGDRAKAQAHAKSLLSIGGATNGNRFSLQQARTLVAAR